MLANTILYSTLFRIREQHLDLTSYIFTQKGRKTPPDNRYTLFRLLETTLLNSFVDRSMRVKSHKQKITYQGYFLEVDVEYSKIYLFLRLYI